MVRPIRVADAREIIYGKAHWKLFEKFRNETLELMTALAKAGLNPIVHGSVARGDVNAGSDIDVFVSHVVPSYKIELALHEAKLGPTKREIIVATPWQLPKAHIYVDDNRSVTFPLVKPKKLELEFYYFGGAISFEQVKGATRAPGVDKRLMLISPTPAGHFENPIFGREAEVAKKVGVSFEIVQERAQVLTRRADVGHTGTFVQRELGPGENFEKVFNDLVKTHPEIKIRLKK